MAGAFQSNAFQNNAFQAEGGAETNAPAGNAAGSGSAFNATIWAQPNAGVASGTGAAFDATITTGISAAAEVATGVGSSLGPAVSIAVNGELASGAGAAYDATISTTSQTNAPAEVAAGTGAALNAAVSIEVNAGLASGIGAAFDATISTAAETNAPAEVAPGVGSSLGPAASIEVSAGLASGTGAALDATISTATTTNAPAGLASGSGSAYDATISTITETNAPAGVAAGSGLVDNAYALVAASAGVATGTGSAADAIITTSPSTQASAGVAAGSGAAYGIDHVSIRVNARPATGRGTAKDASVRVPGIHFYIESLGDIAPNVVLQGTRLTASSQGKASLGQIVVRDIGQERADFPLGKRVTVYKDTGHVVYGGYLVKARRQFWFNIEVPDALQRRWVLDVVSNDILFHKRIVHKQSNPSQIEGPSYTTDTYDDLVINELVENWLDLSADGIDTWTLVHRVAYINDGQTGYPFNGGMTWNQAMQTIAGLPGASWGLDPDWRLYYGDVDEPDAPFGLSNTPNGTTFRGYSESTIYDDMTEGCNDFLALGFGQVAPNRVWAREIDTASVAEHGLWQDAVVNYAVYKQATINRIADQAVNGSPSSQRGRSDPRVMIEATTYEDGLRVGQRVRFIDSTHDFDDVIPIREMEMTFPALDNIRYKMKLTHEIDALWNSFDPPPFIPVEDIPIWIPPYVDPRVEIDDKIVIEDETGCDGCGDFLDTYSREVNEPGTSVGLGTSDAGMTWLTYDYDNTIDGELYVEDGHAVMIGDPDSGFNWFDLPLPVVPDPNWRGSIKVLFASVLAGGLGVTFFEIDSPWGDTLPSGGIEKIRTAAWMEAEDDLGTNPTLHLMAAHGDYGSPFPGGGIVQDEVDFPISIGVWYQFKIEQDYGIEVRCKMWPADDPEPAGWDIELDLGTQPSPLPLPIYEGEEGYEFYQQIWGGELVPNEVWFDDLYISGYDACTMNLFETWQRTSGEITGAWGLSSPRAKPWILGSGSATTALVAAGNARWTPTGSGTRFDQQATVGETREWVGGPFTVRTRFSNEGPIGTSASSYLSFAIGFRQATLAGPTEMVHFGAEILNSSTNPGSWYGTSGPNDDEPLYTFSQAKGTTGDPWIRDHWYHLVIEFDPGATVKAKFWDDGDPEPEAWIAEFLDTGSFVLDGSRVSTFTIEMNGQSATHALRFGPIQIESASSDPCNFLDCSGFTDLDTFNGRTVAADAWGASSSGPTWAMSAPGSATASVGGDVGTVTTPVPSGSVNGVIIPAGGLAWPLELHQKFRTNLALTDVPSSTSGNNAGSAFRIGVSNAAQDRLVDLEVRYNRATGSIFTQLMRVSSVMGGSIAGEDVAISTIPTNTWHEMKIRLSPGEPIMWKIWQTASSEPGYITSARTFDYFAPVTITTLSMALSLIAPGSGNWPATSSDYDFIRNTFCTGGACGGSLVVDDFTRTVASTWGTASSGNNWVGTGSTATAVHSVSGGTGRVDVVNMTTQTDTFTLEIPENISLVFDDDHEFSYRFKTPGYIGASAGTDVEVDVEYNAHSFALASYVSINSTFGQFFIGSSFSPNASFDKTNWSTNEWYTVKWSWTRAGNTGTLRGKIWSDSEDEPGWQLTSTDDDIDYEAPPGGFTGEVFMFYTLDHATPSLARSMEFDQFEICAVVAPNQPGTIPGSTTPTAGAFCEVLAYGNGFTYVTSARFIAGSQTVTVNGLNARQGVEPNGQYTVPVARTSIVFADHYDPDDVVRICYTVD